MKITIDSTTKIVLLVIEGVTVAARIWEGYTDTGIPVHCYITRIATDQQNDPKLGHASAGNIGGAARTGNVATWSTCPLSTECDEPK